MLCPSCGKEVQSDKPFCTNCGATLGSGEGTQSTPVAQAAPVDPATEPTLEVAAPQIGDTTEPTLVVAAPQQLVAPPQPEPATAPSARVEPPRPAAAVTPLERAQPASVRPAQPAQPAPSAGPPQPPRKRYGLYAFIAGLILVICIGAAVAAYLLVRDEGEASSTTSTVPDGTIILDVEAPGEGDVIDLVDLSASATAMGASSVLEAQGEVDYEVENLLDEKPATCWAEGVAGYGIGEFVEFTWAEPVDIYQVRILPGYDKKSAGWDRWTSNGRVRTFDLVFSDSTTESFQVSDSRAVQSLDLSATHTVTSVRFVITGVYEAQPGPHKAEDTSMSELHLWGTE